MSVDEEPTTAAEGVTSRASSPSSDSDSDASASPATSTPTEWLAVGREKRATAGNRMKSMLANEEPDSDLELLFAEDDDDQGFTDVDDDASDAHLDSSSDEEDNAAGADDEMAGEKELERQAKEKKSAQRKRKAQEHLPAKFRKKVRIDPTTSRAVTEAPAPRPKKKSERASWLPTAADAPTRASSRSTTKLSKEQLYTQMQEREARRLKLVKQMEKQAAKREAARKPAMTQTERMKEAERTEKKNSKSLNRWEVAEKQREDERKEKLAALNQRTLRGPFITFWSGTRAWKDGGLSKFAVLEEKPKRKPKAKPKDEETTKSEPDKGAATLINRMTQATFAVKDSGATVPPALVNEMIRATLAVKDSGVMNPAGGPGAVKDQDGDVQMGNGATQTPPELTPSPGPKLPDTTSGMAMPQGPPPSGLAAPAPAPPATPSVSSENKPSSVLAPPALAPPACLDTTQPPKLEPPHSNVLAAPKAEQSEESPATPQTHQQQPYIQAGFHPIEDLDTPVDKPSEDQNSSDPFVQAKLHLIEPDTPVTKASAAPEPEAEPKTTTSTRQAIIYQNFDNTALKDKSTQTQILFGRKMNKLASKFPQLKVLTSPRTLSTNIFQNHHRNLSA